jgi:hypothetical protein
MDLVYISDAGEPGLWHKNLNYCCVGIILPFESELNDTIGQADFLGILALSGGGSVNSSIDGMLDGANDQRDYFYFSHYDTLTQVRLELADFNFGDALSRAGVYGTESALEITTAGGLSGPSLTVVAVSGMNRHREAFDAHKAARDPLWDAMIAYQTANGWNQGLGNDYGLLRDLEDIEARLYETQGVNELGSDMAFALRQLMDAAYSMTGSQFRDEILARFETWRHCSTPGKKWSCMLTA